MRVRCCEVFMMNFGAGKIVKCSGGCGRLFHGDSVAYRACAVNYHHLGAAAKEQWQCPVCTGLEDSTMGTAPGDHTMEEESGDDSVRERTAAAELQAMRAAKAAEKKKHAVVPLPLPQASSSGSNIGAVADQQETIDEDDDDDDDELKALDVRAADGTSSDEE
ncbi:hypothetical protein GPALN_015593 [Globodera pallida]|nr:hypothetical protein GPALN_015593 [Globodera pallida]